MASHYVLQRKSCQSRSNVVHQEKPSVPFLVPNLVNVEMSSDKSAVIAAPMLIFLAAAIVKCCSGFFNTFHSRIPRLFVCNRSCGIWKNSKKFKIIWKCCLFEARWTSDSLNLSDLCCWAKERAATGIFKGIKCDLSNTTVHGRLWESLSLVIIISDLFQLYLGFAFNKISIIMQ